MKNKKGFTLMELLIVIVIIGLLTSIALPMYKKAVEKSKVADALSVIDSVTKSEHNWYLVNNRYTKNFSDLDIDFTDKDGNKPEGYLLKSNNYDFTLADKSIKASRNNKEYILFKSYEDGNIYCIPQTHYICQELGSSINRQTCEDTLDSLWHSTTSSCYVSEQERCVQEYGEELWNDDFCGYENPPPHTKIYEGQKCVASSGYGCAYAKIENGGVCEVPPTSLGCNYITVSPGGKCIGAVRTSGGGSWTHCANSNFDGSIAECKGVNYCGYESNFKNGSVCIGNSSKSCVSAHFTNGSICYANAEGACHHYDEATGSKTTYDETSCCCGACPDDAPKCEDIGKICDPKYMQ